MFNGFVNPVPLILERFGLVEKRLVHVFEVEEDIDFDDLTGYYVGDDRRRVVFFLFEYPSGRRSFETLHSGASRAYARHLPEVMMWVHGGLLPVAPVPVQAPEPAPAPEVRPFQVLIGGAA